MRYTPPIPLSLLALLAAPPAWAQEETPAEPPEEAQPEIREESPQETHTIESAQKRWTLKFEPAAWYMAAEGNTRLPGGASTGNGESYTFGELNLDSPRISPFGELQLRRGDWRIGVHGVGFSNDERHAVMTESGQIGGLAFDAGDTLRSSIDLVTYGAEGEYAF